jgi:hypothetical protein
MLRVRTTWTSPQGGPYLSTHYFTGASDVAAQDAVDALVTFWQAVDAGIMNTYTWTVLPEVAHIDEDDGKILNLYPVTGDSAPGAVTSGTQLPPSNQVLVRWHTQAYIDGRNVRGRTFIPGVPTANNQAGKFNSGSAAIFDTAAEALISDAGSELVVWRRPNPAAETTAGQAIPVSAASVWLDFAILRRRRD